MTVVAVRGARAARVSIASNLTLIALKIVAGVLTGSVAIVTEAVHSSIDLLASVVAYFSVRKAEEPADSTHPYGHEKVESLSAALEGLLILVGAGIIIYEAIDRLVNGGQVERLGLGIAVIALSAVVNFVVSGYIGGRARATGSPALAGDATHLRTDAITSVGVLLGLLLVALTGADALDPITAIVVAGAIVLSGVRLVTRSSRVLVDEALPADEIAQVTAAVEGFGAPEVVGFHKLRARTTGRRRYIDLHVQFRSGTSLERAHRLSHELQAAIRTRVRGADVLIHLEPEESSGARGEATSAER